MTLLVVALLSASVISFMRTTHLEALTAENVSNHSQAQILARAGLKGMLMGNTAEQILSRVEASVLAVKPDGFETPVAVS